MVWINCPFSLCFSVVTDAVPLWTNYLVLLFWCSLMQLSYKLRIHSTKKCKAEKKIFPILAASFVLLETNYITIISCYRWFWGVTGRLQQQHSCRSPEVSGEAERFSKQAKNQAKIHCVTAILYQLYMETEGGKNPRFYLHNVSEEWWKAVT